MAQGHSGEGTPNPRREEVTGRLKTGVRWSYRLVGATGQVELQVELQMELQVELQVRWSYRSGGATGGATNGATSGATGGATG